jgi:hypothetical protein
MGSRRSSAQRIGPVDVIAFALTDGAVALEHVAGALEADERAPRGAAERVRQHLVAVPKDKPRIVSDHRRKVTHLHPSFSLPSQELDVLGG